MESGGIVYLCVRTMYVCGKQGCIRRVVERAFGPTGTWDCLVVPPYTILRQEDRAEQALGISMVGVMGANETCVKGWTLNHFDSLSVGDLKSSL